MSVNYKKKICHSEIKPMPRLSLASTWHACHKGRSSQSLSSSSSLQVWWAKVKSIWTLLPYFGSIFKFKPKLELVFDMTTSWSSGLNLKINPKKSGDTHLRQSSTIFNKNLYVPNDGALVIPYLGLNFKFKPKVEVLVIGLDMTTSCSSRLNFKINLKKRAHWPWDKPPPS
jgi:hypothetical protein